MIIIPARLSSTRLKDKILLDINGVPMFIATAKRVAKCDEVVIALDDEITMDIANKYGIKAVMTDKDLQSGTDRIKQACDILGLNKDEIIINVQADEPFIEPENILEFKNFCKQKKEQAFMFSCYKSVSKDEALSPDLVKVVTDFNDFALYFSRSLIPFDRDKCSEFKAHLGIYGYSVDSLNKFCMMNNSDLERTEKLEQLRVLQNGKKIAMLKIKSASIGIDTQKDYEFAIKNNLIS